MNFIIFTIINISSTFNDISSSSIIIIITINFIIFTIINISSTLNDISSSSIKTMTEHLGVSMELGCFVAGVLISANGEQIVKQVSHLVEPIKDFLSCLFFASIGFHVFPSFVLNELSVTLSLTFGVVTLKFVVGVIVLRLFLPKSTNNKYIVAAGLAQVSEFSFVLGSRARRFHLISRE
ncbi:hypothetical protein QZH41_012228, partial [Actinostola sp. cb2023]